MTVFTKNYNDVSMCKGEILRYAGIKKETAQTKSLLSDALDISKGKLTYKLCYCELPISIDENNIRLANVTVTSASLKKALDNCDSVILFAATVGNELDRLIARYSVSSPATAFMLDAIGIAQIEALCNMFCDETKSEKSLLGKATTPRFSAGYGDLELSFQRDIFNLLDCHKKIGLTLNESLLMSPSKSVSAIIGIKSQKTSS